MKTLKLNRKSWHCWLATTVPGGLQTWEIREGTSICRYNICVIRGLVAFIVLSFVLFLILFWMISPILYIWFYEFIDLDIAVTGGTLDIILLIFLCFAVIAEEETVLDKAIKRLNEVYIIQAIKSFKNKICIKVEFK